MSNLRLKRLLWLAYNCGNCKAFYSKYCQLPSEYGSWQLGHYWLSNEGIRKLQELS